MSRPGKRVAAGKPTGAGKRTSGPAPKTIAAAPKKTAAVLKKSAAVPKKAAAAPKKTAAAAKKTARPPKKISAGQALKNTRALLEAKHERERHPPPWQAIGAAHEGAAPHSGFQSDEARVQATALHKEEMDLDAIQGNISSRDRRKQGKRDSR
jgi:hypothetical protein